MATAAQAADTADSRGISVEVIDLRTLVPLDLETLARSATKTGRVVVYHEAVRFGGFGGELSAQIHEACFTQLRAPVARVGARAIPIPAAPDLEQAVLPNTNLLLRGLDEVIGS